jgi:hypothetical protein
MEHSTLARIGTSTLAGRGGVGGAGALRSRPAARNRGEPRGKLNYGRGTALSLAEVAAHAGFSDQSQFSYHFKRVIGVTPRQFRRSARIALGRLVRRMPRLRFDKERPLRRRADSLVFRGLESLPVRFD